MLVAIVVLRPFPRLVRTRKMGEVKSAGLQLVIADFVLPGRIHAHQDPPVLSQDVVNVPDITCVVAVQPIVKGDAACV